MSQCALYNVLFIFFFKGIVSYRKATTFYQWPLIIYNV